MKNIIFIGTDIFAANLLNEFSKFELNFIYIITKNDKKKGRGQKISEHPVSITANKKNIPVYKTSNINDKNSEFFIKTLNPDIILMVGYGNKIEQHIFNIPKYGILNIHPSVLPKFKGATPIQHAILNGDKETGVSIIQINDEFDSGKILNIERCPINDNENFISLSEKLVKIAKKCALKVLSDFDNDNIKEIKELKQSESFASKFEKNFYKINWDEPAINIDRKIRAFFGIKKFSIKIKSLEIKIIDCKVIKISNNIDPGKIINVNEEWFEVSTGLNALRIMKIQIPGKKEMLIKNVSNSIKDLFKIGNKLE